MAGFVHDSISFLFIADLFENELRLLDVGMGLSNAFMSL